MSPHTTYNVRAVFAGLYNTLGERPELRAVTWTLHVQLNPTGPVAAQAEGPALCARQSSEPGPSVVCNRGSIWRSREPAA